MPHPVAVNGRSVTYSDGTQRYVTRKVAHAAQEAIKQQQAEEDHGPT